MGDACSTEDRQRSMGAGCHGIRRKWGHTARSKGNWGQQHRKQAGWRKGNKGKREHWLGSKQKGAGHLLLGTGVQESERRAGLDAKKTGLKKRWVITVCGGGGHSSEIPYVGCKARGNLEGDCLREEGDTIWAVCWPSSHCPPAPEAIGSGVGEPGQAWVVVWKLPGGQKLEQVFGRLRVREADLRGRGGG